MKRITRSDHELGRAGLPQSRRVSANGEATHGPLRRVQRTRDLCSSGAFNINRRNAFRLPARAMHTREDREIDEQAGLRVALARSEIAR